jgi:hypothetical protein
VRADTTIATTATTATTDPRATAGSGPGASDGRSGNGPAELFDWQDEP